jgi:hypothetical protein
MFDHIERSQEYVISPSEYQSVRRQLLTCSIHSFGGRGSPRSSFLCIQ